MTDIRNRQKMLVSRIFCQVQMLGIRCLVSGSACCASPFKKTAPPCLVLLAPIQTVTRNSSSHASSHRQYMKGRKQLWGGVQYRHLNFFGAILGVMGRQELLTHWWWAPCMSGYWAGWIGSATVWKETTDGLSNKHICKNRYFASIGLKLENKLKAKFLWVKLTWNIRYIFIYFTAA